ncbi:DUF4192 family protein [Streptacidiphilus sp. 4-A2]|nr:DUF4192 family protein [Streptacidiphilus sp. 4-A2]
MARFLVALSEHRDRSPDAVILYLCRDPAPGRTAGRSPSSSARWPRSSPPRSRRSASRCTRRCACPTAAGGRSAAPTRPAAIPGAPGWTGRAAPPPWRRPRPTPASSCAAAQGAPARARPGGRAHRREQLLAFEQAVPALVEELRRSGGREAVRERTAELVDSAVARFRAGAAELSETEAARLILGLQDRLARDRAAEWLDPPDVEHAQRLWRFLAKRCAVPSTVMRPLRCHCSAGPPG